MMRFIASLAAMLFTLAICGVVAVAWVIHHFGKDLPDYKQLAEYDPPMVTRLYAGDGRLLAEYAIEKRTFVPIKAIPRHVVEAFLSAEDKNFYQHSGVDFMSIARAMMQNVSSAGQEKGLVGGSTITQQVVKNFLLTNEKSISRKIKEAILSFRISRAFSKDRILELYLNEIYLGFQTYGVAAAALNYFNKSLDELTVEEAAFLAVLPKAPNNYNPKLHYERAKERRDWVIARMLEDTYLTTDEALKAAATPIVTRERDETEVVTAEFFAEEVRRQLAAMYGTEKLYKGGLVVRTTLDPALQKLAEQAMREALVTYDQRHGYRGPVARIEKVKYWRDELPKVQRPVLAGDWLLAVVLATKGDKVELGLRDGTTGEMPFEEMKWARPWKENQRFGAAPTKPGDVLMSGDVVLVERFSKEDNVYYALRQIPEINGAMVVMDPHTGRVLAMVGGYGYGVTEFNRATQAKRQPGSAFKSFIYLTALENGFTPSSIILDAAVELSQGAGQPMWRPQNYTNKFYGPSTLRKGLEHSRNAMTVRLSLRLGIDKIIEVAKRFGIYDEVQRNFSLVLGSAETTLYKLTNAYAMLVNGGRRIQPSLIERIQDRNGATIYRRDDRPCEGCWMESVTDAAASSPPTPPDVREQIVDPVHAYQMVSILEGVVQRGTATRAKVLERPLGGKTGTTNDSNDTWFVGFSPDLVCGVFVGFDKPKTLGEKETGGSVALPAFVEFMREALKDKTPVPFRMPPGVRLVKVGYDSGQPTAGTPDGRHIIYEAFTSGSGGGHSYATPADGEGAVSGEGFAGEGESPLAADGTPVEGVIPSAGGYGEGLPVAAPPKPRNLPAGTGGLY